MNMVLSKVVETITQLDGETLKKGTKTHDMIFVRGDGVILLTPRLKK